MLTRTISYEDYDGSTVTEDFSFHISKGDVIEMQMAFGTEKDLGDYLAEIIKDNDGVVIIKNFKWFLEKSVGKKEGKHFLKSEKITQDFMSTNAYSELLTQLVTNAKFAAEFINGLFPRSISETPELKDATEKFKNRIDIQEVPLPDRSPKIGMSEAALNSMTKEEIIKQLTGKQ